MWQRKLNIHLLSEVSFAISLSESLRPNFIDIVPEKRIWVIENGVSKDNVPSESEFRVTLTERLNKSVKQVLFLSNLIESKGYRKVLEVAAIERKRIVSGEKQRLKFDFAGAFFDVSERNFFESFVREKKLEDFVTYHGVVKGDKKKQLLQNASIFCLPTWYPVEGQPISMLEAMANGEYIISTKHAAIPDIITSECNGILYDHDVDAVQMHKDMTRLSDAKLEKASNSNRACFFRRYTETKYVDKFDSLFTVLENGL
ncbi:glycosyltransferase family 4 protein [Lacticaseibacillus manihotivorans]|nr:glycosyltransferase family 4 protein [Lacticaseibacillus manihotivorans]